MFAPAIRDFRFAIEYNRVVLLFRHFNYYLFFLLFLPPFVWFRMKAILDAFLHHYDS